MIGAVFEGQAIMIIIHYVAYTHIVFTRFIGAYWILLMYHLVTTWVTPGLLVPQFENCWPRAVFKIN